MRDSNCSTCHDSSVLDRELLDLQSLARTLRDRTDEAVDLRRRWAVGVRAFAHGIDVHLGRWVRSLGAGLVESEVASVRADDLADVLHDTSYRIAMDAGTFGALLTSAIRCVIWTQYAGEVIADGWMLGPEQEMYRPCIAYAAEGARAELDEAVLDLVTQCAHRAALDMPTDLECALLRGYGHRCADTGIGVLLRFLVEVGHVPRLLGRARERIAGVERRHRTLLRALGYS
jgi:hypothetical protein